MVNDYSDEWFSFFLQPIQASQTESEIAFVVRNLPQPDYQTIVDLCCGVGRHANLLGLHGYKVYGIDNNPRALDQAKRTSGKDVTYIAHDMRHFSDLPGTFDAVINLWQSFGYFDEFTNRSILSQIAEKLNSGGRFILDIYHREFFEKHQGERSFDKDATAITENRRMVRNRLSVSLTYHSSGKVDKFDWQLYTPSEILGLMKVLGFQRVITCTDFDETKPPSRNSPRVQYVLEKAV